MSAVCVCQHSADYHDPACVIVDCECRGFRMEATGIDLASGQDQTWLVWDCPDCGTRVSSRYLLTVDSLDAAWAEAEAALPDGWALTSVSIVAGGPQPWQAWATLVPSHDEEFEAEYGSTPAAALRALAATLRGLAR